MFDRISPDYDRMNRLMTFNADQRWRRDLVARLRVGPDDAVLDLACGTGDFAHICREGGARSVGLDFSRGMLHAAARRANGRIEFVQGDALSLPLPDEAFSVALSGFALRNFAAIPPVLAEVRRVLRPGGRLGLLEVDRPRNPLVAVGHGLYFNRVVPLVGRMLSDGGAYRYLPQSVSYLPEEEELLAMIRDAGFEGVRKRPAMFGTIQSISAVRS